MKTKQTNKGFTLVELLVVITIIGILATSGVAVFTTQLQGARDSTRINDMKLFETALHQYFAANDEYPANGSFSGAVAPYMSKVLVDPKAGKTLCYKTTSNTVKSDGLCNGHYKVAADSYGLINGAFKLGVYFEKLENHTNIAHGNGKKTDGGNHNDMYEVFAGAGSDGIDMSTGTVKVY